MRLHISRRIAQSLRQLKDLAKMGSPDALTQIGFSLQFAVCNHLAAACAGTNAVVAFSLCIQSNSILSVFLGALIGSSVPILAVLHGQRDYRGEAGILKTAMIGQLIVAVLGLAVFEIFAPQAAALYNITDAAQAALAIRALRIFSLMYLARCAVIIYFRYLKVIGLTRYAAVISALDGFAAIIPVAWIMTSLFGVSGLWWAFPMTSFLLVLLILVCNQRYSARSNGSLRGPLLFESDEDAEPVLDVTITKDPADIVGISRTLQRLCEDSGMPKGDAVRAALVVEEMGLYAANKKRQDTYMDVLIRLFKGNVEIDFRCLGEPFDPLMDTEDDMQENVRVLRSAASRIENEYILGMNSTRIVIEGKKPSRKDQEGENAE